jgi:hypothetical protein
MSLIGSGFFVAMLLVASWWTFWGAASVAVRIRAGASPRFWMGLGWLGPIGVALAALSVSRGDPRISVTDPFVDQLLVDDGAHELTNSALPPPPE